MKKVRILDSESINAKINRIAYEIAERNYGISELTLAGIDERGSFVAARLVKKLKEITDSKLAFLPVKRNLKTGVVSMDHKEPGKMITKRNVIIVDDVLYSGKTLFTALVEVMQHKPAAVQTAVLIDRGHRSLPVAADYVGLELATTLKQHVHVEVSSDGKTAEVFLK